MMDVDDHQMTFESFSRIKYKVKYYKVFSEVEPDCSYFTSAWVC